jgi:hypothetical protein
MKKEEPVMPEDRELALVQTIKDVVEALNVAVKAAAAEHIRTDIRLIEYGRIGKTASSPTHFVTVRVTKEF